ncbi:MAG: ABC transporter substrate-binding protein, partial [Verrucomicrobiales bacterium]|nr:ABC transporter substrate-binding protein [Verrucomicrobiales bacterium]
MRLSGSILLIILFLTSCGKEESVKNEGANFEAWYPRYNQYISDWLGEQVKVRNESIKELQNRSNEETDPEAQKKLKDQISEKQKELERFSSRQALGDYIALLDLKDLPEDLMWEDGQEEPEIGDPESKKGGAFRYFITSSPPTIRPFGPNSNNSFRGELYDNIEIGLIDLHPETGAVIPGVAKEWAIGADKKTVFFRLDPDAKYNDGEPVKAVDFLWFVYIRASDNVVTPWFKQYLREQFARVAVYGKEVVAVTLPEPKPKLPYFASIPPSASHFYNEYGP